MKISDNIAEEMLICVEVWNYLFRYTMRQHFIIQHKETRR